GVDGPPGRRGDAGQRSVSLLVTLAGEALAEGRDVRSRAARAVGVRRLRRRRITRPGPPGGRRLPHGTADVLLHAAEGRREDLAAPRSAGMLERLERTIEERKVNRPAGSYVASLLSAGEAEMCRKIGEEATEVITAALGGQGDRRVVEEVADLWFHTLVLLGARGIPLREVLKELARRHAGRTIPDR